MKTEIQTAKEALDKLNLTLTQIRLHNLHLDNLIASIEETRKAKEELYRMNYLMNKKAGN